MKHVSAWIVAALLSSLITRHCFAQVPNATQRSDLTYAAAGAALDIAQTPLVHNGIVRLGIVSALAIAHRAADWPRRYHESGVLCALLGAGFLEWLRIAKKVLLS